jgi:hypothetical protein
MTNALSFLTFLTPLGLALDICGAILLGIDVLRTNRLARHNLLRAFELRLLARSREDDILRLIRGSGNNRPGGDRLAIARWEEKEMQWRAEVLRKLSKPSERSGELHRQDTDAVRELAGEGKLIKYGLTLLVTGFSMQAAGWLTTFL